MAGERAELCGACRFWEQSDLVDGRPGEGGYCRRYPPVPVSADDFFWPDTRAYDWCGEFAPRPDAPPPSPPAAVRAHDTVGRWGQDLSDHSDEVDWLEGLGARASGALRRSGIRRVSQLVTWDVPGLLGLPDFGPHSLAQVVAALAARGLALRGCPPAVDNGTPARQE